MPHLIRYIAPLVLLHPLFGADERISQLLDEMLSRVQSQASSRPSADSAPEEAASRPEASDPLGLIGKYVERFSGGGKQGFESAVRRLAPLRSEFERIFAEEGVPAGLIWLGLVESGYNAYARSPKEAVGVWQFIPATAERFGLAMGARDERMDPLKSGRAAAKYLKFLYGLFGDWNLALAAYNSGEQRVADAIRRGGSRDFWILSTLKLLPEETREYVPSVLAAQRLGGGIAAAEPEARHSGDIVYAQIGQLE